MATLLEKCISLNTSEFFELDVSGKHFTITKRTLCSEPNSVLTFMFSGGYKLTFDKENRVTISSDPEMFELILGWLNYRLVPSDLSPITQRKLLAEAKRFELTTLAKEIEENLKYNLFTYADFLTMYNNRKLRPLTLSRANLTGFNFDGLDLSSVNFSKCNVSFASFVGCNLTSCDFSNSKIVGTNFTGSNLSEVRFVDCNLTNTDFTSAQLDNTSFSGSDLSGAKIPKRYFQFYCYGDAKGKEKIVWV